MSESSQSRFRFQIYKCIAAASNDAEMGEESNR
ncbi:uncharacterized protein G2W53_012754 [Senna tora]|uniref:Uncharacterized protein n=1 Tax=Senna tora TaxID=362788 RepID=A0A834WRY5_9FABA|nr:uncharacterized protein G2W53_012754 [Senna tora]